MRPLATTIAVSDAPKARFLDAVRPLVEARPCRFKSVHVQEAPVRNITEACQLVHDSAKSPGLTRELERFTGTLGGLESAVVRDLYFRAYDRLVLFSKGFLDLMKRNDEALPQEGTIVEIGATSGAVSAYLSHASPARRLITVDRTKEGLASARAKQSRETSLLERDFKTLANLPLKDAKGVVLSHLLHPLAPAARSAMLRSLFVSLAEGAVVVLNEALAHDQVPQERAATLLGRLAAHSVLNRSPMTEQDIVFFSYVARRKFLEESDQFLSEREVSDLAITAGFQISARKPSFYSSTTCLVLRKPVSPRR